MTDPRAIKDISGHIVDLLNNLQEAYEARMLALRNYWQGRAISNVPTLDDIRAIEDRINACIREEKRR